MKENFKTFSKNFAGEFYFNDLYKKMYATDASVYRMMPQAVAFPENEEGIKQLIDFALKNNLSLIPRAAGTSLAGQCVGIGIVVDVSKHFTNIISVDKRKKTVTVQPGVIRDELNAFLKPYGLFFGPNTSTSNRCMIGGMVGNNSSGTTSIQYGVTRDKIISLKGFLSNGEGVFFSELTEKEFTEKTKLNTFEGNIYKKIDALLSSKENQKEILKHFPKPEIHRRNTGYALDTLLSFKRFGGTKNTVNLAKLLCGSEGTLVFTSEITLQLDTLPPKHNAMVVAQYASLKKCLNDVNLVMQHDLFTCEMMDDVILNCTKNNKKYKQYRFFIEGNPKALLMLEVCDETEKGLHQKTHNLLKTLQQSGLSYAYPVLKGKQIHQALALRKAGLGLLGNMVGDKKAVACIEDTAVALPDLPKYIEEFTALMQRFNQQAVYYAHAGAGELHLRPILNLKKQEEVTDFREITTQVAHLVKKYKGSFSGEHGDGIVRSEFLPFLIGEKNYQILKEIKTVFDPDFVFNKGKIIQPFKMDASLRYKADKLVPAIKTLTDFSDSHGVLRLVEKCNGSGDCRKPASLGGVMCPSYQATKNEKDSTRARANVLREVLTNNSQLNKFNSDEIKLVLDLCLSCKACATECPSNVDIARVKAEFLYQYNKENRVPLAIKLIAKSSALNKKAYKNKRISNFIFKNKITSSVLKKITGIAQERSLPLFSSEKLLIKTKLDKKPDKEVKIFLLIDEFTKYYDVNIANDALFLLTKLGYKVKVISHLDSARALLSKGFLKEAKKEIDTNIAFFKDKLNDKHVLVGLEPSAVLGFRDDYLHLTSDKKSAEKIAKHTFLIEEFLASEAKKGVISALQFTLDTAVLKIHTHCHQKALSNQKVTFDILNLPENYKPTIVPSGCCGMAGSFGLEKENYEVSMQIGNLKLFPTIRKTPEKTIIVANGTSCRHQIKDGTQRIALHPVTVLRNALL